MRFSRLGKFLHDELLGIIQRPKRIKKVFDPGAVRKYLRFHRFALKSTDEWIQNNESSAISSRKVDGSYEDYIELQSMKLDYIDLAAHEARFRGVLRERLKDLVFVQRGKSVLCLGARLGAEVKAFIDIGCFAVGVDLNPGPNNHFVLPGDFQYLQMADHSVDIVYTNSIDHAFDIDGMMGEILRVVKPEGHIILEPDPGTEDAAGVLPDLWATQSWDSIDSLIVHLEGFGLELINRSVFDYPRGGQQLVFIPHRTNGV